MCHLSYCAGYDSCVITEEKGNQYKGECLFLRALTYHNLMIHYALPYNVEGNNNYGMPIYTKAVNDPSQLAEQQSTGRSTVKDTYDQILSDLNNAEPCHSFRFLQRQSRIYILHSE